MKVKRAENGLTSRDLDIMNILWNSSEPLTATEIVKKDSTLSNNTAQAVLRKLLKNKYTEVADIVYSGTVLCRRYIPRITAEEYVITNFAEEFKKLSEDIPFTILISAFLEIEQEDNPAKVAEQIKDLEILIKLYKERLKSKVL